MSALAIGDVQGCYTALHRLLKKANPSPTTPLWFTGDLINRGPHSLETLRTVMALGKQAVTVLGNHELHLLAVAVGVRSERHDDTLASILAAPDAADLIDWVRHRPLAYYDNGFLLVHAGVLPQWDLTQTLELAHELETALRGPTWKAYVAHLFGHQPDHWHPKLTGYDRLRVIANAFTRIRFCSAEGQMRFDASGAPKTAPPGAMPWFEVPNRLTSDTTIVFGHWAALGLMMRATLCALDTGCVWGRRLTAVTLDANPAQRMITQVECTRC